MNAELFTKSGALRKTSPKKFECNSCSHISNRTRSIRMGFVTIGVCTECGGSVKKRAIFLEWQKRQSGLWDTEIDLLNLIQKRGKVSYEELFTLLPSIPRHLTSQALGNLMYWEKIHLLRDGEIDYYLSKTYQKHYADEKTS